MSLFGGKVSHSIQPGPLKLEDPSERLEAQKLQNSSGAYNCPSCTIKYDSGAHAPRVLPNCGHSICTECIKSLLETTRKENKAQGCPLDKKPMELRLIAIDDYKINYFLRQLIEDKESQEMCEVHGEILRLYCCNDKKWVCDDCILKGEHKDHDIKLKKTMMSECNAKLKDVEEAIARLDKHKSKISSIWDEVENSLKASVNQKFEEMKELMESKQSQLVMNIKGFVKQQKKQAINALISEDSMRKDLEKISSSLRKFYKTDDPVEVLKQEIKEATSKFSVQELNKNAEKLSKELKLISEKLENAFNEQKRRFAELDIPRDDIKHINQDFLSNYLKVIPAALMETGNLFYSDSQFALNIDGEYLEMKSLGSYPKDVEISEDKVKNAKKLRVELLANDPLENIEVLFDIIQRIESLTHLELIWKNGKCDLNNTDNLFKVLFGRTESLQAVKICFDGHLGGGSLLHYLVESNLSKCKMLKSLDLSLANANVRDHDSASYATKMSSVLESLESYQLCMKGTHLGYKGFCGLLGAMPKVKSFCFNFMNTLIGDSELQKFMENQLVTMTNLESLALILSDTQIHAPTVTSMLKQIPNVKNLKEFVLDLSRTQVNNFIIEALVEGPLSSQLESLILMLQETNINDEGMQILSKGDLSSVKEMVLSIGKSHVKQKGLETIANEVLHKMNSLKLLDLDISGMQVGDEAARNLIDKVLNLKSLRLGLAMTKVTDEFILRFAKEAWSRGSSIEELEVDTYGTTVNSKSMALLGCTIQELKKRVQAN